MWRDSGRITRFFFIDGRALFPLLFVLYRPSHFKFMVSIPIIIFLSIIEYYGLTLPVTIRFLKRSFAGKYILHEHSSEETLRFIKTKQEGGI